MIDRVHFENFKSLKDVTIDLGRLTVLVGPNGCGKSSVLQALELLARTGVPQPDEQQPPYGRFGIIFRGLQDAERLASPGRPTTLVLAMRAQDGDELSLTIDLPERVGDRSENEKHRYKLSVSGSDGLLSAKAPYGQQRMPDVQGVLRHPRVQRFKSTEYLHLDTARLVGMSAPTAERPTMYSDGTELASALAWMKGAAEDDLALITQELRRVVPGVKRIRTLRERVSIRRFDQITIEEQPVWRPVTEKVFGDKYELEFDDGNTVPADLLSEGTVLALGLLTKLHEPERPRFLLVDDIDRGLHIEAQAKLVQVLRDLLDLDPALQILCTTHSPYLLDRFEPSEVRVLALDAERHTRAMPLSEHPEFERWKHGLQTGELWATLGHAWVAGRDRPAGESQG